MARQDLSRARTTAQYLNQDFQRNRIAKAQKNSLQIFLFRDKKLQAVGSRREHRSIAWFCSPTATK